MRFWKKEPQPCPMCTPSEGRQEARQVDPRTECKNCRGTGKAEPQAGLRYDAFTAEMIADHREQLARDRAYLSRAVTLEPDRPMERVEVLS